MTILFYFSIVINQKKKKKKMVVGCNTLFTHVKKLQNFVGHVLMAFAVFIILIPVFVELCG